MLLEPIYEEEFRDCSYGFRPGCSAHEAITAIRNNCGKGNMRWIIDADIQKCFDTIDHAKLQEVLKRRVVDKSLLRLIGKWLNAGIMDGLELSYPESGTPQGGVVSPLLANIYLHYVLDEWFAEVVQPRLRGKAFLVRYADDFIIGCEEEVDAYRIMDVLPKRMAKYSLSVHPEKTQLVDFRKPVVNKGNTFDFLGFTFYWSRNRDDYWVIKKRTTRRRKQRVIKSNNLWCKRHRHEPIKWQHERLSQKLQGYYNYFGVTGNYASIHAVYYWTQCSWHKWLNRRGGKQPITWEKFRRILETFPLPQPQIIHRV
jgi:group II intron reverse transcriptase/maturase